MDDRAADDAHLHRPSVMLVEDNDDDIYFTRRIMRASGLRLETLTVVRDGEAALDYLFGRGSYSSRDVTQQPRVVLLDINLPRYSGLDVLTQIREDARTKLVPVVMLTSSRQPRDVVESYRRGANSYIQKPLPMQDFREALNSLTRYWLRLNVGPP